MATDLKPKILVVDDDQGTRDLYRAMLAPFGYEVLEAGDGKEGLEQAQSRKPDLVISDILMPTMNGYEFVLALRKHPSLEHVPVIFHSASFLDREARSLGAACGVLRFILKPCEPHKALAVVHEVLGLKIENPIVAAPRPPGDDPIPALIDAVAERSKQLDAVSVRLATLLELGFDLARPSTIESLLETACQSARKTIGASYCGVGILADDGRHLRSFDLYGAGAETAARLANGAFAGPVFTSIVREKKACLASSQDGEPAGLDLPGGHPPVHSFLGAPLKVGDRVYGWMYVANKLGSPEFNRQDAEILTVVTAHLALAYENGQRFLIIEERTRNLEAEIEERERAESRFRMLVETAPMGIVIIDESGRIADVNEQTLRTFGYEREELVGRGVDILLPDRLRKLHEAHRAGYAKQPRVRPMGQGMELAARRKDGTEFPAEISLGPLAMRDGTWVSATISDITERKKMEEQMRLSQRLEAIGRLAGGVAHDFNNLLGVILGCCDAAAGLLPPDHPAIEKIELMRNAGSSAAELTRQLLEFSQQQMLQPRVLDLRPIVKRVQSLLGQLLGANIDLSVSIEPSLGNIAANAEQIERVILNLAVNARDAMARGGRLMIQARNVEWDRSFEQEQQPVIAGAYVMISVEDTGCGMDPETQARIFEPFFTTKEFGKGTGLGLATVYGIVKQSGGSIRLRSQVGRGTVFELYFPRVSEAPSPAAEDPVLGTDALEGPETILLAEDSASLREIASEYLRGLGYHIIDADSGIQALGRAKVIRVPIHLLLTDVVMPGMTGPELASQIAAFHPGIKVIFASGYADDAMTRQGVLGPGAAFIQKPYRLEALARKIRTVLGETKFAGAAPGASRIRPIGRDSA
ncbi:MAG TPA: response regulator [Candidatus Acidoferrales bacterium]|nr:response regulator [Candidatus Acidoferrales bacterium]